MGSLEHLDWVKIAASPKFVELHKRKVHFLFGWWIASVVFFFTIPLGAGYLPSLFQTKMIGNMNFAYLLVIATFFASWLLSAGYMLWANKVSDPLTDELIKELKITDGIPASAEQPRAHK
jgi:uncharacterized membrane protein (DUF485 family)